jgi:hypothetical protein
MARQDLVKYIRTDKNGTKIFHDYTCPRCCGYGMLDKWINTGKVCFACGGSGVRAVPKVVKEYTEEYLAKLESRRQEKAKKYAEEHAEEIAAKKAEQERIEAEWRKGENARVCKNHGCGIDGVGYVLLGKTYGIKEQIKAEGGKWIYGAWVCPVAIKAKGVQAVRIDLNICMNEYGRITGDAAGDLIYDIQNGITRD